MKLFIAALIVLFAFTVLSTVAWGQIVEENYDYGMVDSGDITQVTSNWVRHSGTQGPAYKAVGLSYSEYVSSGIGGGVFFTKGGSGTNDGDVNRKFSAISTTSNVFVSFLIQIDSARATADYFLHLGPNTIGTIFRGRIFARSNGSGWSLGLTKYNETRIDDNTILNFGQTYLVVLKYSFNVAAASDDQVILYVYSSGVPSTEPGNPIVTIGPTGSGTGSDPSNIGSIAIRQGADTPTGYIDGIRIDTSWNEVPLPVQLTSFSASTVLMGALLNWRTVTETNCYGFEVERRAVSGQQSVVNGWQKVGFVSGNGTSNAPHEYTFTDLNLVNGRYTYRLKQIDQDGSFQHYGNAEVEIGAAPNALTLCNYPNPFNPMTTVVFSIPRDGYATLKVFNILGQEVAKLFNGVAQAEISTRLYSMALALLPVYITILSNIAVNILYGKCC